MDFFNMLLNDPMVYIPMIGLFIVLGICGYYVYYFMKNISESEK
ncbi:DUF3149 domain-containing protein [Thalassotalea marina]|uniref:DUF3149 domain-containing protein n=1 Tax=Thalassotalea marina TaxID=1673741 RepID=A0A919BQC2_9GAMM|nr:DUF3149 domain-containing protein [Thalassotalea marina]GHG03996.1 hypothetical protein GCM10017161_36730 [Thalassotalea marina]